MKKTVISRIAILSTVTAASLGTVYYQMNAENARQAFGQSNVMENNGKVFEKEKTPVTNMVILLKILNNSALCDSTMYGDGWYDELEQCIAMLNTQITNNKDTQDTETKEILRLQQIMVNNLNSFKESKDKGSIDKLQESYNKYQDYYNQLLQGKGGTQS